MLTNQMPRVRKDPVTGVTWYTSDELLATLKAALREASAAAEAVDGDENMKFASLSRVCGLVLGCHDIVRTMLRNYRYLKPRAPLGAADAFALAEAETMFGYLSKVLAMQDKVLDAAP